MAARSVRLRRFGFGMAAALVLAAAWLLSRPARPIRPPAGAADPFDHGPFLPGAFPGEPAPPEIRVRGSYVGGDAFRGIFTTGWYARRHHLRILVAGYPNGPGNSLRLELRRRDGSSARLDYTGGNSGGSWAVWAVDLPPEVAEYRIVATDGSAEFFGWLAVSEPFTGGLPLLYPPERLRSVALFALECALFSALALALARFLAGGPAVAPRGAVLSAHSPPWAAAGAAAILAAEAWRQYRFIDRHAVNILFWDQWAFFQPIIYRRGWWAAFDFQVGPHREGLGGLLALFLSDVSGCNARWDAFAIGWLVAAAAAAAVLAAWRCGCRHPLALALLPIPFFNFHQFEGFVGASNPAHGGFPLLLLMLCCIAWTFRGAALRAAALAVLTGCMIFTGFGVFAGLVVPPLLAMECVHRLRQRRWGEAAWGLAAVAAAAVAWRLFSLNYHFAPAVSDFRFPYEKPSEYLVFMALMMANFHGLGEHTAPAVAAGAAVWVILLAIAIQHARACWRQGPAAVPGSAILVLLCSFELLYCANTAVGRVTLGLSTAPFASRYVPLEVPASVAILGQLYLSRRRLAPRTAALYAAILIPATTVLHPAERQTIAWFSDGKAAWKKAYLATRSEARADELSHFRINPGPVKDELAILERQKANLFLPEP